MESARRAYNDALREATEKYTSVEQAAEAIKYRFEQENYRYIKTYNVDRTDMSNYDLVVDTTDKTPEEVFKIVLDAYKQWLKDKE